MYGPSDMYGDMSIEDVEEFEGLESDDGQSVSPNRKFERNEFRKFDEDFAKEMLDAEDRATEEQWGWDDDKDDHDDEYDDEWDGDEDRYEEDTEL